MSQNFSTSELTDHQRHSIIALKQYANWSTSKIAKTIKTTNSTVNRTLKRWKQTGDVKDIERTGRPPKINISDPENNYITEIIRKRRKLTGKQIQKELEKTHDITVTLSTVHRLKTKLCFKAVRFRRVPGLTDDQKRKRLEYVTEMEGEDWEDMIFTDESMFEEANGRGTYLKHRKSPNKLAATKGYPPKVMVWGGIWTTGRTKLHICEGNVDSDEYCNILFKHLIEDNKDEFKTVLQDGAKSHTSKYTKDFIKNFELEIKQNPPHSPDLNPIEKIWGWMKQQQQQIETHSREELITLLHELWEAIPQDMIARYIKHNTKVAEQIKEAKGGNI
jgi:transposase